MSEYYTGGDMTPSHDGPETGYEQDNYAHDSQGQDHQLDQQYNALAEFEANRHDVDYDHAHHVEYEDGHGGRYEETDVTSFHEHDANVESLRQVEYAEHERDASYADDTFFQHAEQVIGGEFEGYGHELPAGGLEPHGLESHGLESHGLESHGLDTTGAESGLAPATSATPDASGTPGTPGAAPGIVHN